MEAPKRLANIQTPLFGIQLADIIEAKKKEDAEDKHEDSKAHPPKLTPSLSVIRDIEAVYDEIETELNIGVKPSPKNADAKQSQVKLTDFRRLSNIPSLLLGIQEASSIKTRKTADKDIFKEFINSSQSRAPLKYPEIKDLRAKASDLRMTESILKQERLMPVKRPSSVPKASKFNAVDTAAFLIHKLHADSCEIAMKVREEKSLQRYPDSPLRRIAILTHATELEQAACMYFAQLAYSKFGSLHGFLAALCYSIDSRDAIMRSPISLKDFIKFVDLAGMQQEAADIVFETVRRSIGGDVIHSKDFICLAKYFEVSLLDFHDWAGHLDKPPKVEEKEFIRPNTSSFSPLMVWLYQSGIAKPEGYAYHVRKRPNSVRDLLLKIQKEVPDVVPFGFKANRLYDSFTHLQVTDVSRLVHGRKYLVTGAYQPDWVKFEKE